jgi:hypothetical protein
MKSSTKKNNGKRKPSLKKSTAKTSLRVQIAQAFKAGRAADARNKRHEKKARAQKAREEAQEPQRRAEEIVSQLPKRIKEAIGKGHKALFLVSIEHHECERSGCGNSCKIDLLHAGTTPRIVYDKCRALGLKPVIVDDTPTEVWSNEAPGHLELRWN